MRLPARRLLLWFALVGAAFAADEKPLTEDPLTATEPAAELVKFAASAKIPLNDITLGAASPSLEPGLSVTLFVTLMKEKRVTQYLIRLTTDRLTESERAKPLPADIVIYSSTGRSFNYAHAPAALRVELIGPFPVSPTRDAAKVTTRTARAVVNGKFLSAGIAQYCRDGLDIAQRIQKAGVKDPVYFAGGNKPPPEAIAKGKRFSDAIQLTEVEERAAFSVYFSLTTFFGAAMEIPAVRNLLEEVVAMPSVWSIVRNFGVRADFNYFWPDARAVEANRLGAPVPVFQLPVRVKLNGQWGAQATFVVTDPRGPLTTCAGILALCAQHPTDPTRKIFIRVLAATKP